MVKQTIEKGVDANMGKGLGGIGIKKRTESLLDPARVCIDLGLNIPIG